MWIATVTKVTVHNDTVKISDTAATGQESVSRTDQTAEDFVEDQSTLLQLLTERWLGLAQPARSVSLLPALLRNATQKQNSNQLV